MCGNACPARPATIAAVMVLAFVQLPRAAALQVRDTMNSAATQTAIVRGRVVLDEPAQPVRHATVIVANGKDEWQGVTDDAGAFTITGVTPGRVTIAASKPGYLDGAYRATRPGRPGVPAILANGQILDITLHVGRGAVISGRIVDRAGEPIAGLLVFPIKASNDPREIPRTLLQPDRHLAKAALPVGTVTDDLGEYRLFGLPAAEYLVMAAPQDLPLAHDMVRRPASEVDEILNRLSLGRAPVTVDRAPGASSESTATRLAFASVFYPGTAAHGQASTIALAPGEQRENVDFVFAPVPVSRMEGTLVTPGGAPPEAVQLSINPVDALQVFALGSARPNLAQPPTADGRFVYTNVPPGRVRIVARARGNLYAAEEVVIGDAPVTQVTVRLQPGARLSGRVMFDVSNAREAPAPSEFDLILSPTTAPFATAAGSAAIGSEFATTLPVDIANDGTFAHQTLASARYRLSIRSPASPNMDWWVRTATLPGRGDVIDGLDVALDEAINDLVVTITDRPTTLHGTLQASSGLPAPEYYIVVFPADRTRWSAGATHVRATRPEPNGTFTFERLPGGTYLIAALTDVEPDEWQRAEFLASIAPAAVRVTVVDGAQTVQNLRIAR